MSCAGGRGDLQKGMECTRHNYARLQQVFYEKHEPEYGGTSDARMWLWVWASALHEMCELLRFRYGFKTLAEVELEAAAAGPLYIQQEIEKQEAELREMIATATAGLQTQTQRSSHFYKEALAVADPDDKSNNLHENNPYEVDPSFAWSTDRLHYALEQLSAYTGANVVEFVQRYYSPKTDFFGVVPQKNGFLGALGSEPRRSPRGPSPLPRLPCEKAALYYSLCELLQIPVSQRCCGIRVKWNLAGQIQMANYLWTSDRLGDTLRRAYVILQWAVLSLPPEKEVEGAARPQQEVSENEKQNVEEHQEAGAGVGPVADLVPTLDEQDPRQDLNMRTPTPTPAMLKPAPAGAFSAVALQHQKVGVRGGLSPRREDPNKKPEKKISVVIQKTLANALEAPTHGRTATHGSAQVICDTILALVEEVPDEAGVGSGSAPGTRVRQPPSSLRENLDKARAILRNRSLCCLNTPEVGEKAIDSTSSDVGTMSMRYADFFAKEVERVVLEGVVASLGASTATSPSKRSREHFDSVLLTPRERVLIKEIVALLRPDRGDVENAVEGGDVVAADRSDADLDGRPLGVAHNSTSDREDSSVAKLLGAVPIVFPAKGLAVPGDPAATTTFADENKRERNKARRMRALKLRAVNNKRTAAAGGGPAGDFSSAVGGGPPPLKKQKRALEASGTKTRSVPVPKGVEQHNLQQMQKLQIAPTEPVKLTRRQLAMQGKGGGAAAVADQPGAAASSAKAKQATPVQPQKHGAAARAATNPPHPTKSRVLHGRKLEILPSDFVLDFGGGVADRSSWAQGRLLLMHDGQALDVEDLPGATAREEEDQHKDAKAGTMVSYSTPYWGTEYDRMLAAVTPPNASPQLLPEIVKTKRKMITDAKSRHLEVLLHLQATGGKAKATGGMKGMMLKGIAGKFPDIEDLKRKLGLTQMIAASGIIRGGPTFGFGKGAAGVRMLAGGAGAAGTSAAVTGTTLVLSKGKGMAKQGMKPAAAGAPAGAAKLPFPFDILVGGPLPFDMFRQAVSGALQVITGGQKQRTFLHDWWKATRTHCDSRSKELSTSTRTLDAAPVVDDTLLVQLLEAVRFCGEEVFRTVFLTHKEIEFGQNGLHAIAGCCGSGMISFADSAERKAGGGAAGASTTQTICSARRCTWPCRGSKLLETLLDEIRLLV
eukprot:g20006.t1